MRGATDSATYLAEARQAIAGRMASYFDAGEAASGLPLSGHGRQALELLQEFAQRPGKQLRGTLALVSYEMFGGTSRAAALDVALAMELTQAYLLIVDDVMDRSQTRRGGLALQVAFAAQLSAAAPVSATPPLPDGAVAGQDPKGHLANMLAINVGLVASHLASAALAAAPEQGDRVAAALGVLHRNITATAFGQIDDLYNDAATHLTEADITRMYRLKSSYYTFISPLQAGAALAGASEADAHACQAFGLHAGLAFQLQDDLLGMFGDAAATGKSPLDDLREGKQTLLVHYALGHASSDGVATLKRALGNPKLTLAEHKKVQQVIESSGARDYVRELAAHETAEALKVLRAQTAPTNPAKWDEAGSDLLAGMLQALTERKL